MRLAGTVVLPKRPDRAIVLVHGAGVDREEGGFFTRLAQGLGKVGVASLRYDLRGHGESGGRQEEVTLSAHLNDIRVAVAQVREATGVSDISLLGTSFGGGLAAYYAAKQPDELTRLVLLNPQLNYKARYIDQKPHAVLAKITAPTLIVHGTEDTFIPIESSRAAMQQLQVEHKLVEIDGAQHGFAVHDDPRYLNLQSQEWQTFVIQTVADWLTAAS
ncbi:MAG: alpha/beta hydrolase [Pseudonocardiaceae bacterium]